ncbi:MAG TPA: glycosyltransferase family 4 protein [Candidatus Saccharimonadales bacterium]|nr:glycosyltransferase family 4 protein [Candidatus Saccharimonadales bacterium]
MARINLGIVSQTPVVRIFEKHPTETIRISNLGKNEYVHTVGGVSPLINAQLEELSRMNAIRKAVWFSLNPNAPRNILISKRVKAVSIHMEGESSRDYVNFKEEIWNNIHSLSSREFTIKEYLGYFRYNSKLARIMLQDHEDLSLFEIHDFQQLLLGAMLGPSFPTILRWHIPFVPEILNRKIRKFIINGLEGNDAVIVSTKRDLQGLIRAGYHGSAYQIYPHIDPGIWKRPERRGAEELASKLGILPRDFVVVNVARMDAMKSQDDLIKAVALLKGHGIKLLLVGGGSFSSGSRGLGHPKGAKWLRRLRRLARRLGIEDRVIFTDRISHQNLERIYSRADLMVLPSRMEGFGLVVIEGWTYGIPAIVSSGAGVSELIMDDLNGLKFKPGDFRSLARRILSLYEDEGLRTDMGRNAHRMARLCHVSTTAPQILETYKKTIAGFE